MCCAGCSMGVQWFIFVVRFWVHFVKILRNIVFWFWNHIYSGQCGHSNAVCVLFLFLLGCLVVFFLSSFFSCFNSQNRWKNRKKNCECKHHDTETHWCKSQEIFHSFSDIFKVHSLNVTPGWLRPPTTENFKETIQH